MKEGLIKELLVSILITFFIGTIICPIVNAQFSIINKMENNDNNDYLKTDEKFITFTIQNFNDGKVIDEYEKKLPTEIAIELFKNLEEASNTNEEIEILESNNIISNTIANDIKSVYFSEEDIIN